MIKTIRLNNNNTIFELDLKNMKAEEIYEQFKLQTTYMLAEERYNKNLDFCNKYLDFAEILHRINKDCDDIIINLYEEVKQFLPYSIILNDIFKQQSDYIRVISDIISDIWNNNILEWSRKHIYITWYKNCMQNIQIQKYWDVYDINIMFRSQSYKCFWLDLIQFLYPICESILNENMKIWNVVLFVNNMHE